MVRTNSNSNATVRKSSLPLKTFSLSAFPYYHSMHSLYTCMYIAKCAFFILQEFGEVPTYLTKRKEEIKRAQEEYDQYIAEHFRRGALRQLTEEERAAILDGLKTNWEDIHDQYQGLSVVPDTAPKKNRKERMEAQMKQLERDIELFQKHKIIYIGN